MTEIPPPVVEFGQFLALRNRSPAYFLVDDDGLLVEHGGELQGYGFNALERGQKADAQLVFLTGLLPPVPSPFFLPNLEIASGVHVDLHIFPGEEDHWVLLLDATSEARRQQQLSQAQNELLLLREGKRSEDKAASILKDLLSALGIVVLERCDRGGYRLVGTKPPWYDELAFPEPSPQGKIRLESSVPFLENFLVDAEQFWTTQGSGHLKSGPWTEASGDDQDYNLEATALSVGDLKLLLIDSLGHAYEERQSLFQRARRTSLDYQRLLQETQSKEILLHCIVHDLRGPLTGIRACLDLLGREPLGERAQPRLDTAIKASSRLEGLVADILDIFGAEVASLARFGLDDGRRPDVAVVIKEVVNMMASVASRENVELRLDPEGDWGQIYNALAEESRLERVLFNLLENALRHAPTGSKVTIGLRREGGSCLVTVEDEGDGLPPELAATFFQKFSSGARKGRAGLGLYFCKLVVESWGGDIGFSNRPQGGARFWFRLQSSNDIQ